MIQEIKNKIVTMRKDTDLSYRQIAVRINVEYGSKLTRNSVARVLYEDREAKKRGTFVKKEVA